MNRKLIDMDDALKALDWGDIYERNAQDAIAALPAVVPTVRLLVWEDFDSLGAKASGFYQANYLIQKWKSEGRYEVSISYPGYQTGYDGPRWHDTLEAAKTAAQADYTARVLAALEPAAPHAQCCMCGKTGLSIAEDGGPECELHDGRWVCSRACYDTACSLMVPALTPTAVDASQPADPAVNAPVGDYYEGLEEGIKIGRAEAQPDPACDHCGMDPAAIREAAMKIALMIEIEAALPTSTTTKSKADAVEAIILALIAKGAAE